MVFIFNGFFFLQFTVLAFQVFPLCVAAFREERLSFRNGCQSWMRCHRDKNEARKCHNILRSHGSVLLLTKKHRNRKQP